MKKSISFSWKGQRADVGDMVVYRLLPNRYAQAVGPFIFLDHIVPQKPAGPETQSTGTGAHPHRGIATLSYILSGEDEHFDSRGNHARVSSGGVQWMNAGNGILHDETLLADPLHDDQLTHALQFWINLPSKNKAELPQYFALAPGEVPVLMLPDDSGWIKIIAGNYENLQSGIPMYSKQFFYHLHLTAGSQFTLPTEPGLEYAAFFTEGKAMINENRFSTGEFIEFGRDGETVEIENLAAGVTDLMLFGGEPYTEPIVAEGPFVMNSHQEIANAYKDFFNGKYGQINYSG